MREVDTQRQLQAEEDEERARVAFAGAGGGRQQGNDLVIEGWLVETRLIARGWGAPVTCT